MKQVLLRSEWKLADVHDDDIAHPTLFGQQRTMEKKHTRQLAKHNRGTKVDTIWTDSEEKGRTRRSLFSLAFC